MIAPARPIVDTTAVSSALRIGATLPEPASAGNGGPRARGPPREWWDSRGGAGSLAGRRLPATGSKSRGGEIVTGAAQRPGRRAVRGGEPGGDGGTGGTVGLVGTAGLWTGGTGGGSGRESEVSRPRSGAGHGD